MPEASIALVSGGTGFVGSALIPLLQKKGYLVRCLTRDVNQATLPDDVEGVSWADVSQAAQGTKLVVHLAGAQAVGKRLTDARKKVILDSRVETTKTLVDAMAQLEDKPSTFLCASAIGYYGDAPWGEEKDESSKPGDDFLAQVCIAWEKAAVEAQALGIRTVRARIGIVLGNGGPLEVMARPFKMFVGGPIAGGKQPFSWIDLRDAAQALVHCAETPTLSGPVNIVGPSPTTNGKMSQSIARVLKRPNLFPVPKAGLRLLFSDGADTIASGQQVLPKRLLESGFSFSHEELESSLRDHLL